ncbi:MAG TPA: hypothetical protein VGM86_30575 [Thermoanaerobaculia bacterium]|jgi:ABC-type uncharacterized transport system permease subunit
MEPSSDRYDRRLNGGCGAVVGFFVGFLGALQSGDALYGALAIGLGVSALVGLAAWLLGQKFLDKIFKWLSWLDF